jgi:Bacterial regulatory helix-turn-helix protein, lysR family
MELRQLTIFRAVAKTLNFTKAATSLNYVQSNVTAQIHALEEELGVPLFDRLGGKQVVLTDAGLHMSSLWVLLQKGTFNSSLLHLELATLLRERFNHLQYIV